MSKHNQRQDRFFTIKTPKKDSSILDQFLTEFGYSPFETEERPDDSRRSIKQLSKNEELIEEVADFCKEYSCSIYLIYKEKGKLMEQFFRGKQVHNAKEYGQPDPTPELTENDKAHVQNFLNNNSNKQNYSNNKNNNKNNNQKKLSSQKSEKKKTPKRIGVMSEKNYKPTSKKSEEPSKPTVITKKRRKI